MIIDTKTIRILALALALWSGSTGAIAQSNTASTSTLVTDASVDAIVRHNNITYLGGAFQYIGARRPFGAVLDGQTGLPVSSASQPNGPVYAAVSDGSGGWYIGGSFSTVGGTARDHLAHILSDGTLDNAFTVTANNIVYALTLDGSKLYVGGDFTEIGGTNRLRLAAVTISSNPTTPGSVTGAVDETDLDVSMKDTGSASVRAIAVSSTEIFVGGRFTRIKTTDRNNIASILKSDGSVNTSWNPNADRAVWTIALSTGPRIFVGGEFTNIGGQTRSQLAELNSTGVALTWNPAPTILSSNPSAETLIRTLAVGNGRLYVGGNFATIAGQPRTRMAAFTLADGEIDPLWTPKADKYVTSMAVSGSTVYAAGSFTFGGSETSPRMRIVALNGNTGAPMNDWVTGSAGTIYAVAPNSTGTHVYAGGDSESIGGSLRNHLAALDASGNLLSFNPQIEGSTAVWALAVDATSNVLYIGGTFERIAGENRRNLAAWNIAGSSLESWAPNPDRPVYALALSSQNIYAGGVFTEMSGTTCRRLAAFERSSRVFRSWDPGIRGMRSSTEEVSAASVRSIAVNGSQVIVGGDFTDVGADKRYRIAAFTDGTTPALNSTWNPGVNPDVTSWQDYRTVNAIAVSRDGSTVYVGGDFILIGGASRTGIAALQAGDGSPLSFFVSQMGSANRLVNSIALSGNTLYLGGKNVYFRNPKEMSVVSVDASTGAVNLWDPNLKNILAEQANVVAMVGSELMAGGNMSRSIDRNKSHLLSFAVTEVGWIGGNGGSWNVADNWNPGAVPTSSSDVTIASGYPIMDVDHTVASGKNLTISGSGSLEIAAGKTLTVDGIADFNGRPVTLRSTATGTASIGRVSGSLQDATDVTVERYIPAGRRWRFLTAPLKTGVTSNTVFANWQRNGSDGTATSTGVTIWGPGGGNGLAVGPANSMLTYAGSSWSPVSNTNTAELFGSSTNNAFALFVTGPYSSAGTNIPSGSAATTLSARGSLISGNHEKTLSATPGANQFFLVANPYASSVLPSSLSGDNLNNTFWMWDASAGSAVNNGLGIYVGFDRTANTYSVVGGSTGFGGSGTTLTRIESGQAFFAQASAAGTPATILFEEGDKSNSLGGGMFGPTTPSATTETGTLRLTLQQPSNTAAMRVLDGAVAFFYANGNAAVDRMDGDKMMNGSENVFFTRDGRNLTFEHRPMVQSADTLQVRFTNMRQTAYRLTVSAAQFGATVDEAHFIDRVTGSRTRLALDSETAYDFNHSGDPTASADRFLVVLSRKATFSGTVTEPVQHPKMNPYPNPVTGTSRMRVDIDRERAPWGIRMVDASGRTVWSRARVDGNEIRVEVDMSRMNTGVYHVEMTDSKGNRTVSKVLKQ